MRIEKEKGYPGFQVGLSFLPVIFVNTCLVLLGVLALAGALRDKGYSDKIAEKTTNYYAAVSEAQHKLGEIDKAITGPDGTCENCGMDLEDAGMTVSGLDGVAVAKDGEELILSYAVPITESQSLFVEVEVLDPEKGDGYIKIVKWQEASGEVWEEWRPEKKGGYTSWKEYKKASGIYWKMQ